MNERTRAYIYRLLTPVAGLLVFYGVFGADEAELWISLGTITLMAEGGLAAVNTNTDT